MSFCYMNIKYFFVGTAKPLAASHWFGMFWVTISFTCIELMNNYNTIEQTQS